MSKTESGRAPSEAFCRWMAEPAARLAIFGATGWVGRSVVESVLTACPDLDEDRLRLFGSRPSGIERHGRLLRVEAVEDMPPAPDGDWCVMHAAIIGPDRIAGDDPGLTRALNDQLMARVLAFSQGVAARSLTMFSSGAAALAPALGASPAKMAYSRLKADHEALARDWSHRTGLTVCAPRIFNLGGPFINHERAYALGDFILQAMEGHSIRIGARHEVIRTYVHTSDLAAGALHTAVTAGCGYETYDVCTREAVELGDLARRIAIVLGRPDLPILRPEPGPESVRDIYTGQPQRFEALLASLHRTPLSLERMITDCHAYLADQAAMRRSSRSS